MNFNQKLTIGLKTAFKSLDIGESFVKPDFDILVVYVKTSEDRAIDISGGRDVKVWEGNMAVLKVSYLSASHA